MHDELPAPFLVAVTTLDLVAGWERVGEFHAGRATITRQLNGPGGWSAESVNDRTVWAALQSDGAGVVADDGAVSWLGVANPLASSRINGETIVMAGASGLGMLADVVPLPVPGASAGPWATARHVVSGEPVAAWVSFIGAHLARGFGGLTVAADGVAAGSVQLSGRWAPHLLGLVSELATGFGVAVEPSITSAGPTLVVRPLRSNLDLVVSPDLGGVAGFRESPPTLPVTAVYVGGSGEGAARQIVTSSQSGPRRREVWLDQQSVADAGELAALAAAHLAANRATRFLEVTFGDGGPVFGVDYLLGDLVTIDIPGVEMVEARVTEVSTTLEGSQFSTRVRVGDAPLDLTALLASSSRRLGRLEGR